MKQNLILVIIPNQIIKLAKGSFYKFHMKCSLALVRSCYSVGGNYVLNVSLKNNEMKLFWHKTTEMENLD